MTKWGSIKIRLEDILVVKRETFTDGQWFSGYCHQYRWGIEHTHWTCLNFTSTPKTWLESSCQAPNHLLAPAILRSKCWYPPTAPRALKKGTLSNHHLRSNPKKHINQNSESTDSDGLWHRLILKLRFALKNPNSKRFGGSIKSSQILTKLCETIQYTETPRPKVDQTTIIDLRFWGVRPPSRKWIPLNHGDHAEPPNALAWSHSHTSTHGVNCVSRGKYDCISGFIQHWKPKIAYVMGSGKLPVGQWLRIYYYTYDGPVAIIYPPLTSTLFTISS